jgi:hypothetical protein
MKTSLKLLIGTLLLLIVAMFGAAISVRKQYDSLDKTDRYARWKKEALPPFRVVQLVGPSAAVVQIEAAGANRLLHDPLNSSDTKPIYTAKVERDTLFLKINPVEGWQFRPDDEDDDIHGTQIVVQCNALRAIETIDAHCQLDNYTIGDSLTIRQRGKGGRMVLDYVKFKQLTASLSGKSQLTTSRLNTKIGQATISLADSARLHQYSDFPSGLSLSASPTASLRLTGRAVQQLTK